jgi:hypothetical protein
MFLRRIVLSVVAIAMLSSCSELDPYDYSARAVVEAYLRPGLPIEVLVSKEGLYVDSTNVTIEYIDGLTLNINDGTNNHKLQSIGGGRYISGENVVVEPQKTYVLNFEYNDKNLEASTWVPSKPTGFTLSTYEIEVTAPTPPAPGTSPPARPEPIDVSWENPDGDYHLVVVKVIEENPEKISSGAVLISRGIFRNEPNTGTTYEINQISFQYYGMHAVILYKLNPEYSTLYDDSGNSSLSLKAPYSNISNGLGIFTALNSDTLYLNVKKP